MSSKRKPAAGTRVGIASSVLEAVARYERIALVLQGGGALGAYQCGVYEAMHEAGIHPDRFSGALIAGARSGT